jgi:hypothetical protein
MNISKRKKRKFSLNYLEKPMYTICPNPECSASWGIEELSFQECDACGWPDVPDDDSDDESTEQFDDEED